MKNTSNNSIIYFLLTLTLLFGFANSVQASKIYFLTDKSNVQVGSQFELDVMVNPEAKIINAIDAIISYSTSNLKLVSINEKDSIISLWIKRPKIGDEKVNISGVVPGGFAGVTVPGKLNPSDGKLISLVFEATKQGAASIQFEDSVIGVHDGFGTKEKPQINSKSISISLAKNTLPQKIEVEDKVPPEEFTITVVKSKYIYDGKNALVWNAIDKDSGIDHFEIKEGDGPFIHGESPYLLRDQELNSIIEVKAVDRAGNETISKYIPPVSIAPIIIIAIGFIVVVLFILWKKYYAEGKHSISN